MKKMLALLSVAIFATAILALAADDAKPELRPVRKLMQDRKAWLAAINKNLGAKQFEAVAKDAEDLAAQTRKVGENQTNPLARELDMSISSLARDISVAAANQDSNTIKTRLGDIKDKCSECHTRIRDKK